MRNPFQFLAAPPPVPTPPRNVGTHQAREEGCRSWPLSWTGSPRCPGMVQNHAEGIVWGAMTGSFVTASIPAVFLGSYSAAAIFGIGVVISGFQAVGTVRQALTWRQVRDELQREFDSLQREFGSLQEEFVALQEEAGAMIRRRDGAIRNLKKTCRSWEASAMRHIDFPSHCGEWVAEGQRECRQPSATHQNVVTGPWEGTQ